MSNLPTAVDLDLAAKRIYAYAHRTPVLTCQSISRMVGTEVFFKCENFQKVGAFKFRGACNAVHVLSDSESARGVTTHSSGNHGAALALAAKIRGIKSTIVMPKDAPKVKKDAVSQYGGQIVLCDSTIESREEKIKEIIEDTGMTLVHPYNDYRIIAGQGTVALELFEEVSDLDAVLAPIGGGGLISGVAIAASHYAPRARIIAAEPSAADDAYRSLQEGRIVPAKTPTTVADGLRTSLGSLTFPIVQTLVSEIVLVDEPAIIHAMRLVWERMKLVIEPSAAVPVAALLDPDLKLPGKKIGVILSGGNVDLDRLPWAGDSIPVSIG